MRSRPSPGPGSDGSQRLLVPALVRLAVGLLGGTLRLCQRRPDTEHLAELHGDRAAQIANPPGIGTVPLAAWLVVPPSRLRRAALALVTAVADRGLGQPVRSQPLHRPAHGLGLGTIRLVTVDSLSQDRDPLPGRIGAVDILPATASVLLEGVLTRLSLQPGQDLALGGTV